MIRTLIASLIEVLQHRLVSPSARFHPPTTAKPTLEHGLSKRLKIPSEIEKKHPHVREKKNAVWLKLDLTGLKDVIAAAEEFMSKEERSEYSEYITSFRSLRVNRAPTDTDLHEFSKQCSEFARIGCTLQI